MYYILGENEVYDWSSTLLIRSPQTTLFPPVVCPTVFSISNRRAHLALLQISTVLGLSDDEDP